MSETSTSGPEETTRPDGSTDEELELRLAKHTREELIAQCIAQTHTNTDLLKKYLAVKGAQRLSPNDDRPVPWWTGLAPEEVDNAVFGRALGLSFEKQVDAVARQLMDARMFPPADATFRPSTEWVDGAMPDYLLDHWIPKEGEVLLVGESGIGKSFYIFQVCCAIAAGHKEVFGISIQEQGPIGYIAGEGAAGLRIRFRLWCQLHDLDPKKVPLWLIDHAINLRDPRTQERVLRQAEEAGLLMTVIDTAARCTPGADENSSRDMGDYIGFTTSFKSLSKAAVTVQHPTKASPKGSGRGSNAMLGAADTEIRVAEKTVAGVSMREISCSKQKDEAPPDPVLLVPVPGTLVDPDGNPERYKSGREITSVTFRRATQEEADAAKATDGGTRDSAPETRESQEARYEADDAQLYSYLIDHPRTTARKLEVGLRGKLSDRRVRAARKRGTTSGVLICEKEGQREFYSVNPNPPPKQESLEDESEGGNDM